MYILTYLSILRLIPIQTLVIWLLVGCCKSGCPVIKVTRVKYGRQGRIDLGSCPYRLSLVRKFSSYTPLYAWRLCRLLFIVYKVNHFFSFVF